MLVAVVALAFASLGEASIARADAPAPIAGHQTAHQLAADHVSREANGRLSGMLHLEGVVGPLPFPSAVSISISGPTSGKATTRDGRYSFAGPPGTYTLTAEVTPQGTPTMTQTIPASPTAEVTLVADQDTIQDFTFRAHGGLVHVKTAVPEPATNTTQTGNCNENALYTTPDLIQVRTAPGLTFGPPAPLPWSPSPDACWFAIPAGANDLRITSGITGASKVVPVNVAQDGVTTVLTQFSPDVHTPKITAVTANTGGRAKVSFTTPATWKHMAANYGAKVTRWLVTAQPGGRTATCTPNILSPWAGACTVTGLTPMKTYRFTVKAFAGVYPSAASTPSTAATMPAVPTPIRNAKVTYSSGGGASIVWSPPASPGFPRAITYKIRISGWQNTSQFGPEITLRSTNIRYFNLVKGSTYRVQIVAVNGAGRSPTATILVKPNK